MEDLRKVTETTKREGLEIMYCTEGQADCKAGRAEKSKPEGERSRAMAEKTVTVESDTKTELEGWNKESATTFLEPGTWTIILVNSEILDRWGCCLADQGGEERKRASVRGLYSVKRVNSWASWRKQKWRTEE